MNHSPDEEGLRLVDSSDLQFQIADSPNTGMPQLIVLALDSEAVEREYCVARPKELLLLMHAWAELYQQWDAEQNEQNLLNSHR